MDPARSIQYTHELRGHWLDAGGDGARDLMRGGRVTAVGVATAIVVGLVIVTPAAGFVGPLVALAMGAIGAIPSYFALIYRAKTKLDDSLDVVAVHGLGRRPGRHPHRRLRRCRVVEPLRATDWNAILTAARTGEVGDRKIMVLPIEEIYRIRTREENQDAVTPVDPPI